MSFVARLVSAFVEEGGEVRFIALDIHRDFCEVAIAEGGAVRWAPRVKTDPETLELFAASLGADDQVTLETTGNALAVARIIEPHSAASCSLIRERCAGARAARSRRTRSTRARSRGCSRVDWCRRCDCRTSGRGGYAGSCRGGRSWCGSGRGRRIRCTQR